MTEPKPIIPTKTPDFEESTGEQYRLGCQNIRTKRGEVHAHDAPGILTFTVAQGEKLLSVGVLLYDAEPTPETGRGVGLIAQLDAQAARRTAVSLLRLADKLDGGRGKH